MATVVFTTDRAYLRPLAAAGRSLIDNGGIAELKIVVMGYDLTPSDEVKLRRAWRSADCDVEFCEVDKRRLVDLPTPGYLPVATYSRLLIPDMVSGDDKKVIYLDSDTLTLGRLSELVNLQFEGAVAAVQSPFKLSVSAAGAIGNWQELGLDPETPYFNDGVMILDLDRWRREDIGERALEHARKHSDLIRLHEQEALNAVLRGGWHKLESRFNYMRALDGAEDTVVDIVDEVRILHFVGPNKPWWNHAENLGSRLFREMLGRADWSE